jgi:hypothetical protein
MRNSPPESLESIQLQRLRKSTQLTDHNESEPIIGTSCPLPPGRNRLGGSDHDSLAESSSLTDMGKRGGNLVEPEGAVDVDVDLPRGA